MRGRVQKLVARVPRRAFSIALLVPLTLGAVPAQAQDIFGFFRLFAPPVARVPAYEPYAGRVVPDIEPRPVRRRPKVVRVEPPPIQVPVKPKTPGEVANPVPELLADGTLRRGDIVMFPDGPRVFSGQVGAEHALAHFEPVSRAGPAVPAATRQFAAKLRPGRNDAWSAEKVGSGGKLALKAGGPGAAGGGTPE